MAYDGQSTSSPWPSEPYKGLQYYSVEDRRLFFGRQTDIETCMHRLTSIETRIVLLHGLTGCGKSSFLRAGLIPCVEDYGPGYYFLRDDADRPLFIRCGHDPLGRLAAELYRLAQNPIVLHGANQRFDISDCVQIGDRSEGRLSSDAFIKACRKAGVLCRVLQSMSQIVPATLVIVLDQAEEVITAPDEGDHKCRQQFFRFIREFSAVNFPVKLVVALRSEYSGQFIELGLYAGGIDLRVAAPGKKKPSHATAGGAPVRADLKLFHLRELRREEVREAIELPTSESEEYGNPFAIYRFRYAAGVVQRIVDDLFSTSSTAVLPAMQLTCRDLYKSLPPDREIREKQYVDGGRISGPVDRHVSKSLRNCFTGLAPNEMAAEERRWRNLLCHLVHGESDGTVRTRIISVSELSDRARELGVRADVDTVVESLAEPDVLLLRYVTSTVDSRDDKRLSLGHDFIGMVLHRWRATEEATRLAKAKIEAVRRRARRIGLAALGCVVFVLLLFVLASTFGAAGERYDVLVNRARYTEKSDYRTSMLAATQAIGLAKQWRFADAEARAILARIVAGRPVFMTSKPRNTNTRQSGTAELVYIFPLLQSNGFVTIQNDELLISSKGQERSVRLKRSDDATHVSQVTPQYQAVEIRSGTILIVRSAYRYSSVNGIEPYSQIHAVARDAVGEIKQITSSDELLRNIDAPWNSPQAVKEFSTSASPVVDISGGIVTVSILKRREDKSAFWVREFAFDESKKKFVPLAAKLDQIPALLENALKFPGPRRIGAGFVVPEPGIEDGQALRIARYARPQDGAAPAAAMVRTAVALPPGERWQFIGSSENNVGGFLFFATRAPTEEILYGDSSLPKLGAFEKFHVADVASQRTFSIDVASIRKSRERCGVEAVHSGPSTGSAGSHTDTLFFAQHAGFPLIVLSSAQSAELVEIKGDQEAICLGSLLFSEPMESWTVTDDGAHLLGTSKGVGMRWSLSPPLPEQARKLAESTTLVSSACASDLKALIRSLEPRDWPQWSAAPNLPDRLTWGLCETVAE